MSRLTSLSRVAVLALGLVSLRAEAAALYPPTTSPKTFARVNGRSYVGTAYQALPVLDGDANDLVAQGWTATLILPGVIPAAPSAGTRGCVADRPIDMIARAGALNVTVYDGTQCVTVFTVDPVSHLLSLAPGANAVARSGDVMTGPLTLSVLGSPQSTPLSIQANGKEFLRGFDAGGGLMRIWGQFTADASAAQWLNNGQFVIATENASNSIVGFTVNNLPANTTAFPTGLTGIARVQTPGNTAFALYGEGHLATSNGVAIGAEIDAFAEVNSGPASFSNLNLGIGTPQSITNSLTLGAGTKSVTVTGTTVAGNTTITGLSSLAGLAVGDEVESGNIAFGAAITAINVGANSITIGPNAPLTSATVSLRVFPLTSVLAYLAREGGTQGVAQYGFGLAAGAVKQWGYYQDSSGALGANNGGFFGYNGNGAGMVVQYTVATNPLFAAYQLIDPTGAYKWGVRQSGQMDLNGPTATSVGAAGAASVLPSNPTGYVFIYVGGLQKRVPYYE